MEVTLPEKILRRLADARHVVVLTGGGISAEIGFPSFAQAHIGEWAAYDVSELATPQGFVRNPRLVWEWYDHRRRAASAIAPTGAYVVLAELEQIYTTFTLVTQTIDGLHARAGIQNLIELNGSLHRGRCYDCGIIETAWDDDGDLPPRCPDCGGHLRPDVVMFGEGLAQQPLRRAQHAVAACDLLLCVGAIAAIEPVSSFPFAARRAGALVLSVARDDDSIYTMLADYTIDQLPGSAMDLLLDQIRAARR